MKLKYMAMVALVFMTLGGLALADGGVWINTKPQLTEYLTANVQTVEELNAALEYTCEHVDTDRDLVRSYYVASKESKCYWNNGNWMCQDIGNYFTFKCAYQAFDDNDNLYGSSFWSGSYSTTSDGSLLINRDGSLGIYLTRGCNNKLDQSYSWSHTKFQLPESVVE